MDGLWHGLKRVLFAVVQCHRWSVGVPGGTFLWYLEVRGFLDILGWGF